MFRPDYEKFKAVAATEIKAPYFLDNWYNYRLESEGASLNDPEGDFQFITEQQQKSFGPHISHLPLIKIRDSRTSMIEFPNRNFINQGIWIDIFPLDPVPPFKQENQAVKFEIARTFLTATIFPQMTKNAMLNNERIIINNKDLERFLAFSYRERGALFDNFFILYYFPNKKPFKSEIFSDVIYLPFEKIEVPAPADYDNGFLQTFYGDWRKPVFKPPHVLIYSAEIPWREYFKNTAFK